MCINILYGTIYYNTSNLHLLDYFVYLQTKIYLLQNKLANMLWIVWDFEGNPYIKFSKKLKKKTDTVM